MAIIISQNGKNAKKVEKSNFEREGYLQKYIFDNPDSIPLYDIKEDIRLLILAREFPTGSGPVDELGVDRDGELYPIETKLFNNSDKRRVVAQVLDYGSSLWHTYADPNEFIRILDEKVREKSGVSLEQRLKDFFDLDDDGVAELIENMRRNLSGGNFRFVVLMDELESRLKDLILFLNRNSKFTLFAVEIEYYKYENNEIIIPKLFGAEVKKEIGTSPSSRNQWNEQNFFEDAKEKTDERTVKILNDLFSFSKENADQLDWGVGQAKGSFIFKIKHPGSDPGLVSLIDVRTNGTIVFRLGHITRRIGKDAAGSFYDKLSALPAIKKWNKEDVLEANKRDALSTVLPDQEAVEKLKSAILEFKKELITK